MTEDRAPATGEPTKAIPVEVARLLRRVAALEGALRALSAAVVGSETLRQQVEDLESTVGELARTVARLAEDEEEATRPERPIWWPDVTDVEQRRASWELLGAWFDNVIRGRHPDFYKSLRGCWYQHPDVVDELSALRVAWYGAYQDKRVSATAPIEWHDRWLPASMARCTKALAGCKSGHETISEPKPFDEDGNFRSFVAGDTA